MQNNDPKFETFARALAGEAARALATLAGADAASTPVVADGHAPGWLVIWRTSGDLVATLSLWFERDSAMKFARTALPADREPDADAISDLLREISSQATAALGLQPDYTQVTFGAPAIAVAPLGSVSGLFFDVAAGPAGTCRIGVAADPVAAPVAVQDERLQAVLDVELPLVVRFGQAVMPLRALASLGPGSMVDMNRSPDEPVELLVGERVIARGEVVIVAGNYGLRVTEMVGEAGSGVGFPEA